MCVFSGLARAERDAGNGPNGNETAGAELFIGDSTEANTELSPSYPSPNIAQTLRTARV